MNFLYLMIVQESYNLLIQKQLIKRKSIKSFLVLTDLIWLVIFLSISLKIMRFLIKRRVIISRVVFNIVIFDVKKYVRNII